MIGHDLLVNVQCDEQKLWLLIFALNMASIETIINLGKSSKIVELINEFKFHNCHTCMNQNLFANKIWIRKLKFDK
jgi:hypothetical protein